MAETWEATKRAAQSIQEGLGSVFTDVYQNIGNSYQQLQLAGHLYPSMDRGAFNREFAESAYEPTKGDWKEYERHLDQSDYPDPEPEM